MDGSPELTRERLAELWPPYAINWLLDRCAQGGYRSGDIWSRIGALVGRCGFDGYYQAANPTHHDLLGWTLAELRLVPWWEFAHPDDRDGMVEGIEVLMHLGRWEEPVMRFLTREGRYRWTRWSFLAEDEEQAVFCFGIDEGDATTGPAMAVSTWSWDSRTDAVSWTPTLADFPGSRRPRPAPTTRDELLALVAASDRTRLDRQLRASPQTGEAVAEVVRVDLPEGPAPMRLSGAPEGDVVSGIAQTLPVGASR